MGGGPFGTRVSGAGNSFRNTRRPCNSYTAQFLQQHSRTC